VKPLRLRAVFFDVGGTLIHQWPSVGEIYARVAARHGIHRQPDELERRFHDSWRALKRAKLTVSRKTWWRQLVFRTLGEDNEGCFEELFEFFAHAEAWRIYPDVMETLREIRASGLHVGVISNWDERLRPLLGELGVAVLLDSITISYEVGAEKPRPEIFRAALETAGVSVIEAIHIGDSADEDLRGAEAAGMKAVVLDRAGVANDKRISNLGRIKPLFGTITPPRSAEKHCVQS